MACVLLGAAAAALPAAALAKANAQASLPSASPSAGQRDLIVAIDDGGRRVAIARRQGDRWQASCTVPSGASPPSVQATRRVVPRAIEWKAAEPVVRDVFERREREQRVGIARTSRVPVTLDALYAAGSGSDAVYYFEASKRIEGATEVADPDTDPAGLLRIRVTGWLHATAAGLTAIASKADLQWEQLDRAAATAPIDLVPIGTLREGDAMVWVMKRESSAAPVFILYETRAAGVRMLVRTQC